YLCALPVHLLTLNLHPTLTTLLSFFFHDPPTTDIYTLSLHDALPISPAPNRPGENVREPNRQRLRYRHRATRSRCRYRSLCRLGDRKSTRLNSSHVAISYAVFCLKKKKRKKKETNV